MSRALEWLQRRTEGETVAEIAHHAGVSEATIKRATDDFGPFPADRGPLRNKRALQIRTEAWVRMRRNRISVAKIAAQYGVTHQSVSRATSSRGPFPRPSDPTPQQLEDWVAARRAGASAAAVAAVAGVAVDRVREATRPFGPFKVRIERIPPGLLTPIRIAQRLGVGHPTVIAWDRRGYLPAPDFILPSGRRFWLEGTIDRWLEHADLTTCPDCGARVRRLGAHHAKAHPQRPER